MSNYPIIGCGLPSKPRAAQPSMFQILSWPGDKQVPLQKFEQPPLNINHQEHHHNYQLNEDLKIQNLNRQTIQRQQSFQKKQSQKAIKRQSPKKIVNQTYKQHKQPSKQKKSMKQTIINQIDESLENKSKTFINSKLYQKQIRHQLYSYQPVHLKSQRSKSVVPVKKDDKITQIKAEKEEPQLDQKTIHQRKQKIKEFQIFTRALPNSAFTTYYGKPAFQAYGRGTSGKNLKSYNIMPHKGDNHPKNVESHYTALMKGRNIKSKSYLPRKSVQENIVPSKEQHQNEQLKNLNFPLQKPDLIKSNRFATERPQSAKKAGPPIMQKSTVNGVKRTHTETKQSKKFQKKPKQKKQKKTNDGLKYMNERQNLIDLLQQKKMKASQLAYKVTQCYPSQLEGQILKQSFVSKQNWCQSKPAGKATLRSDQVSDLIHSKLVLKQKSNKIE